MLSNIFPKSFSLGQMSSTIMASFTVCVVVAGPGFNKIFLETVFIRCVGLTKPNRLLVH